MRTKLWVTAIAVLMVILVGQPVSAAIQHNKTFLGDVVTVRDDAKEITIKNEKTNIEILLHWSDVTKLPATPLKSGDHVKVTYSRHHGVDIASHIAIVEGKTPAAVKP